jgi:hypothetical protein
MSDLSINLAVASTSLLILLHVHSLQNVGGSTQVPVRAWNNAREGTWGLPPPVKLERRDMTVTVSMWCITQKQNEHSGRQEKRYTY